MPEEKMTINILIFGQLKDITGSSRLELANVPDLATLQQKLIEQFPLLANTKFAIAVDKKIVRENISLHEKNEVALLPPFSGG